LFPANFVTTDLNAEPEQFKEQRRRSVQFNEEVEVVSTAPTLVEDLSAPEISEDKIDTVLNLLHEADPTQPESDAPELPGQEDQVYKMGPLIDAELEAVDRRHAQLTRLSTELVDALNLYHQLMHENIQGGYGHMQLPPNAGGYNPYAGATSLPTQHQQQPPPPQFNGYFAPPVPPNGGAPTMAAPQPHIPLQPPAGAAVGEANQMYAGSAPPPPTPPMPHHDPAGKQQTPPLQQPPPQSHFTPQQAAMASEWLNGGGVGGHGGHQQPPVVSGYQNHPMPQM
jgi:signal transducing adaptor molecule